MATSFYKFASRPLLWMVVLTFPLLSWQALSIRSNNNTETWLPRDTPERAAYEQFKRDFGVDEVIVIGMRREVADPKLIEAVASRIELIPGIRGCWTPARMIRRMGDLGVEEAEAHRRLEGLLVGPNGQMTGLVASLTEYGAAHRHDCVRSVRGVLEYCQLSSPAVSLTGGPVVVSELDRLGSPDATMHFFVAMLCICGALLQYSLRDFRMSLSVLGVTLWSIYLTQALLHVLGGEMNFIMGALSVMVMVFTLSIAVHLLDYYTESRDRGDADPLGHALRESLWPCLLSTVTTLLGLVSLNVSRIKPVGDFGYAAALGAVIAMLVGLGVIPALVTIWPNYAPPQPRDHKLFNFSAWGALVARRRWSVLACGGVLAAASALGVMQLVPRLDPVDFLPRSNVARRDLRRIEQELTGVSSIEAVLDFGESDSSFVSRLEHVRGVEELIQSHPAVRHTLSTATFFPRQLPENPLAFSRLISKAQQGGAGDGLLTQDQRLWRISVRLTDSAPPAEVCAELAAITKDALVAVRFTGIAPMLANAQAEIFSGFWRSFTQALLTITLVMILALRSVVVGLVAMAPNVMPILLVFGIVGFCGLPVDIGMMMTGSIALGISVDCTFHFLVTYRSALSREGVTPMHGCQAALEHTGRPLVESTVISTIGMLALCLSSFTPTSRFGWLMASQMTASLLGEMLMLPALLCVAGSMVRRRKAPVTGPHFRVKTARPVAAPIVRRARSA